MNVCQNVDDILSTISFDGFLWDGKKKKVKSIQVSILNQSCLKHVFFSILQTCLEYLRSKFHLNRKNVLHKKQRGKKRRFCLLKTRFLSSADCLIFRWKITSRSEKVLSQFPHLKLDLERHNRYWNWKIKDTKFIIQGFPSDQEELSPTKWTKIGNFAN